MGRMCKWPLGQRRNYAPASTCRTPRLTAILKLSSIARLPDEKNEGRDQSNHDKHPVLNFESQKGKMPDKKLHRQRPLFVQAKGFGGRNILFFYAWRVVQQLGQRRGLLTSGRVHNEGHGNTFLRNARCHAFADVTL